MKDFSRENKNQIVIELQESADTLIDFAKEKARSGDLALDEFFQINKDVREIFNVADQLTASILGDISQELNKSTKKVQAATNVAKNALKTLGDIKKALKISEALVNLALAIAGRDVKGIVKSAKTIIDIVNKD